MLPSTLLAAGRVSGLARERPRHCSAIVRSPRLLPGLSFRPESWGGGGKSSNGDFTAKRPFFVAILPITLHRAEVQ